MERHTLVELQGPGGRCKVPEKEKEAYLKRKGWKEITVEDKIEEKIEKEEEVKEPEKSTEDKVELEQVKEEEVEKEDMDTPAEPVEPKKLIPTTREVMKSRTSALSKLVEDFELDINLKEYDTLNDKRMAVDSALNNIRGI